MSSVAVIPGGPGPAIAESPRPPPPPRSRVAALDGLRGLAILMVLAMHYYYIVPTPDGPPIHDVLRRAVSLCFSGVDLFFVLSGYLIGGMLMDHRDSSRLIPVFFWRRLLRIVPPYALLLVSFLVARSIPSLAALSYGEYFTSPVPLWSYLAMLQNIAMSWAHHVGNFWLSPTWSLGVEEQFYLLMPFVVRWLSRRTLAYVCVLSFVVCPMLRLAALLLVGNSAVAIFLLPMRADSLLAGVLCAIAIRDSQAAGFLRGHHRLLAGVLASLAAFLALLSSQNYSARAPVIASFGYSVIGLFFAGALLWLLLFPDGRPARALGFRPLCALGIISYFVYLFHLPVDFTLHWAVRGMPPWHNDWQGGAVTLLALAVTLLLGAVSWRYLESPLLRLGRRATF